MSPCILNGSYIIAPIQGNAGMYVGKLVYLLKWVVASYYT